MFYVVIMIYQYNINAKYMKKLPTTNFDADLFSI